MIMSAGIARRNGVEHGAAGRIRRPEVRQVIRQYSGAYSGCSSVSCLLLSPRAAPASDQRRVCLLVHPYPAGLPNELRPVSRGRLVMWACVPRAVRPHQHPQEAREAHV